MDFNKPYSYNTVKIETNKKNGRICFNHLAGLTSIKIKDKLHEKEYIEIEKNTILLTDKGKELLNIDDIDVIGRLCFDWSEKEYHIGGELGEIIMIFFINRSFIEKNYYNYFQLTDRGISFLENI